MHRSLTLILVLGLLGSLPLAAAAAQPKLGSSDRAAVTRIFKDVAAINLKFIAKDKAALDSVQREYVSGCQSKYESGDGSVSKPLIRAIQVMHYMRFVKLGYPFWSSFSSRAERVQVSHPLLKRARSAFAIERSEGAKIAKVTFGVCDGLAQIAAAGMTEDAVLAWAGRLINATGYNSSRGTKADAMIKASRPVLLAAGLTSPQANLMLDYESGEIFASLAGVH